MARSRTSTRARLRESACPRRRASRPQAGECAVNRSLDHRRAHVGRGAVCRRPGKRGPHPRARHERALHRAATERVGAIGRLDVDAVLSGSHRQAPPPARLRIQRQDQDHRLPLESEGYVRGVRHRGSSHRPVGPGRRPTTLRSTFRYAGRVLVVVGVAVDVASIVQASRPMRRASQVVAGWAASWAGCRGRRRGRRRRGHPGLAARDRDRRHRRLHHRWCRGYLGGSALGGEVYDWAENTFFTPLPEVAGP